MFDVKTYAIAQYSYWCTQSQCEWSLTSGWFDADRWTGFRRLSAACNVDRMNAKLVDLVNHQIRYDGVLLLWWNHPHL